LANYPGTNIPIEQSTSTRVNRIVDNCLTPRLLLFRMITIYDEQAALKPDGLTWGLTYGNWLEDFVLQVRKNSQLLTSSGYSDVDYTLATLKCGVPDTTADGRPLDVVNVTYQFDYFPIDVLEDFLGMVVNVVNTGAYGPPTNYTIDNAPDNWDGVLCDLAFALAMERLLLDYDLWRGRLIFALGPEEISGGSGDITGQLETLKSNAEERANKTMDNEKFKSGNYLSPPTATYYNAVRGLGAGGSGFCGGRGYGRMHGARRNKWW